MILPGRKKRRARAAAQAEAEQALQEAREHLQAAVSRRPAVMRVAGKMRQLQQDNHFAELWLAALEEGGR